MIATMKMSSGSVGGNWEAQSRTSRPGGASVRNFWRNRYHICCAGDSSESSVPMEWNALYRFCWIREIERVWKPEVRGSMRIAIGTISVLRLPF